MELQTTFALNRAELDAVDRGADDPDLGPLVAAARRVALAEDHFVFEGHEQVGVRGLATASPHEVIEIGTDYSHFPRLVARAGAQLRDAGIEGPYGVILGPRCHTGVIEGTERGGYPVLRHLQLITGGPLVRSAAFDGAGLLSMRGGDFQLVCGQDLAIGYETHDAGSVTLRIEESITFRDLAPEAVVVLRHSG